jgi:hypothetical protein
MAADLTRRPGGKTRGPISEHGLLCSPIATAPECPVRAVRKDHGADNMKDTGSPTAGVPSSGARPDQGMANSPIVLPPEGQPAPLRNPHGMHAPNLEPGPSRGSIGPVVSRDGPAPKEALMESAAPPTTPRMPVSASSLPTRAMLPPAPREGNSIRARNASVMSTPRAPGPSDQNFRQGSDGRIEWRVERPKQPPDKPPPASEALQAAHVSAWAAIEVARLNAESNKRTERTKLAAVVLGAIVAGAFGLYAAKRPLSPTVIIVPAVSDNHAIQLDRGCAFSTSLVSPTK